MINEAMKMETTVQAPFSGTIKQVHVKMVSRSKREICSLNLRAGLCWRCLDMLNRILFCSMKKRKDAWRRSTAGKQLV